MLTPNGTHVHMNQTYPITALNNWIASWFHDVEFSSSLPEARNVQLSYFLSWQPERSIEQTCHWTMIWDVMTLIRHCNSQLYFKALHKQATIGYFIIVWRKFYLSGIGGSCPHLNNVWSNIDAPTAMLQGWELLKSGGRLKTLKNS